MGRSKKNNLFVIFRGPEQIMRPGTKYYAKDASATEIKTRAAKFYSFDEATEFAKKNNIELSSLDYIGIESFSESDITYE